jgi:EAL and modified HD-GYP domain-containing signal transduction protein
MKTYTARQPIFDSMKRVKGYELLYREDENNRFPAHVSSSVATSKLLLNSFFDTDIEKFTNGKLTFINFPIEILKDKFMELLPNKNVIIEILETVKPNQETFNIMKTMFHKGYRFALDDFEYDSRWDKFLPFVKIIKFDIMNTQLDTLPPVIAKIKKMRPKMIFLAEKIETYEEFAESKRIGCKLFQGFFFAKPEIIINQSVPPTQIMLMELYREISKPEINFNKICSCIEKDVSIAFKLLRYVNNSGLFNTKKNITSIKDAVIYMGERLMKKFVFLIITAELSINKPIALMKTAIQRAKFCELIASNSWMKDKSDTAFLIGLFSVLDAILDRKMNNIMEELPLEEDIKNALVNKIGVYSCFIKIAESYDRADWDVVNLVIQQMGLSEEKTSQLYIEATAWSDNESIVLNQPISEEKLAELKKA